MAANVRKPCLQSKSLVVRLSNERRIALLADGGKGQETLARRLPFLNGITRKQNKATAYVCIDYACELPTNNPAVLSRILNQKPAR